MYWRGVAAVMTILTTMSCATQLPFQWGRSPQTSSEATVELIEERREMTGGISEVVYRLELRGFSVEKPLELWTKHGSEIRKIGVVVLDEQGKLRWKNKKKEGDFSVAGLIVRGLLYALDRSKGKEVSLVHGKYYLAEATRKRALRLPPGRAPEGLGPQGAESAGGGWSPRTEPPQESWCKASDGGMRSLARPLAGPRALSGRLQGA